MRRKMLVPQMWNSTKLPPHGTAVNSNVRRDGRHEANSFHNCFANAPHNTDTKCLDGEKFRARLSDVFTSVASNSLLPPPLRSWMLQIATAPLCTDRGCKGRFVYTELTPGCFVDLIRELNHFLRTSDQCFYFPGCLWSFRDSRWHDCGGS
jgi:hypothetical protein